MSPVYPVAAALALGGRAQVQPVKAETSLMMPVEPKLRCGVAFSAATEAPSRVSGAVLPWAALPRGVVDGGEIVILATKPSLWRPVFESAPWLVTSCLLAAVLTWLSAPIPALSLALTAQLVLLVGLFRLAVAVVRWVPTWYVLTNRRILNIHGVRAPVVMSCLLIDIRNTYLRTSPVERAASLGSIIFVTDQAAEPPQVWRSIGNPDEVHKRIRRAIEGAIDQFGG